MKKTTKIISISIIILINLGILFIACNNVFITAYRQEITQSNSNVDNSEIIFENKLGIDGINIILEGFDVDRSILVTHTKILDTIEKNIYNITFKFNISVDFYIEHDFSMDFSIFWGNNHDFNVKIFGYDIPVNKTGEFFQIEENWIVNNSIPLTRLKIQNDIMFRFSQDINIISPSDNEDDFDYITENPNRIQFNLTIITDTVEQKIQTMLFWPNISAFIVYGFYQTSLANISDNEITIPIIESDIMLGGTGQSYPSLNNSGFSDLFYSGFLYSNESFTYYGEYRFDLDPSLCSYEYDRLTHSFGVKFDSTYVGVDIIVGIEDVNNRGILQSTWFIILMSSFGTICASFSIGYLILKKKYIKK
ncbi:hypothetical protein DSAG12_00571 [Promethearchaeum syntrophicum]|uniref:Uncharacterized protein n=1 Tax=Promethearchaeum syntrophicum TaxID=2594042 RepID=A0A5B9D831_9ARCH|nr:hypothetical protein [Candidatus Prometheoarchaeum syntrophicum]QEE14756.1 hypothetical protein DSAG12_00571 [Candidatus Prometheoarchaeum syntrophicum]